MGVTSSVQKKGERYPPRDDVGKKKKSKMEMVRHRERGRGTNTANLDLATGERAESRLSAGPRRFGTVTSSCANLDVASCNSAFL